jgi:hypothetical protein
MTIGDSCLALALVGSAWKELVRPRRKQVTRNEVRDFIITLRQYIMYRMSYALCDIRVAHTVVESRYKRRYSRHLTVYTKLGRDVTKLLITKRIDQIQFTNWIVSRE